MKWYHPLYVGESVQDSKRKMIRAVKKGSIFTSAYLVCMPLNQDNLFDIIPAREIGQKGYPKDKLHIIGLCGSKDEAIELVAALIQDTIKTQNNTDVYSYLKGQWRR